MLIKLRILITIFSIQFGIQWKANAQEPAKEKNIFNFGKAMTLFKEENYQGALITLEQILRTKPNDPELLFYAGRCNLELKNPKAAFEQLIFVASQSTYKAPDMHFWLARAYQDTEQPDSALANYEKFKRVSKPGKLLDLNFEYYVNQTRNLKKFMANPVNVKFKNLGENINSDQEDISPTLNAEGNILIFSSRRSNSTGNKLDPYDGKYYQDIYMSVFDTVENKWGRAKNLDRVNGDDHDANMTITPDGNSIFIYKNIPGKTGSGDIWISKSKGEFDYGKPKEFEGPFNSSYFETSASLAPGGKTLYYISERPDGKSLGNGDIWVCERISRKEWGKPVNAGPVINTLYDEVNVYIHPNGKTLFFSSKGHDSMGGYDIFKSELKNGKWITPVNLGYPINTPGDEIHFTLSADGKKGYYAARKNDTQGDFDLYEIDFSEYEIIEKPSATGQDKSQIKTSGIISVIKGKVTDGSAPLAATVIIYDEKTGVEMYKVDTDEMGMFFITADASRRYRVEISAEGFQTSKDSFFLGKKEGAQPFTLVRNYFLSK